MWLGIVIGVVLLLLISHSFLLRQFKRLMAGLVLVILRIWMNLFGYQVLMVTKDHHPEWLSKIIMLRYKIYCEKGFFGENWPDIKDFVDDFDKYQQALNVTLIKDKSIVMGTLRLVPSNNPLHVLPAQKYVAIDLPKRKIIEMGRLVLEGPSKKFPFREMIKNLMMVCAYQECMRLGYDDFLIICHKALIRILRQKFSIRYREIPQNEIPFSMQQDREQDFSEYFKEPVYAYLVKLTVFDTCRSMCKLLHIG
jgi:N-acyl-L-homoserine lactone synthetase